MTDRIRKVVMGIAAIAALALGGAALANAAGGDNDQGAAAQERGADERSDQAPGATAVQKARDAAAAETGGKPGAVELDNENGATYEVEVVKPDGTRADVRLDESFGVVVVEADHEDAGEHQD